MGAKFLTLDTPAVEAKGPLDIPRAKALRRGDVQHRGRTVTFVALDNCAAEKTELFEYLIDAMKKRREARDAG